MKCFNCGKAIKQHGVDSLSYRTLSYKRGRRVDCCYDCFAEIDPDQKIERLRIEVSQLREALAFYSLGKNYVTTSTGFNVQYDPESPAIEKDNGTLARDALGYGKKGEQ